MQVKYLISKRRLSSIETNSTIAFVIIRSIKEELLRGLSLNIEEGIDYNIKIDIKIYLSDFKGIKCREMELEEILSEERLDRVRYHTLDYWIEIEGRLKVGFY